jgi:ATP-binding cassette, subfamily C, bacterial CydD
VAFRVWEGKTAPEAVAVFLFLAVECARPMMELNRFWHASFQGLSAAGEFCDFMSQTTDVPDTGTKKVEHTQVLHTLSMEKVTFSYSDGNEVLKNISFTVQPGKMTALVGHSGSGKSTILNLLLRFYDPDRGVIKLNQEDIRDYSLEELRKQISAVFQETYLFYGTIADNIRMARPDATDEEVEAAAKAANAHEFIDRLPNGYQTVIGERGMTLSGGERQRISIARAFLKNAPILFLDEATSSIDSQSESIVQESIQRLIKGKTTVVVAHRLATIRHADQILVIEGGKVMEQGTHEELLNKNGIYTTFIKAQEEMQS